MDHGNRGDNEDIRVMNADKKSWVLVLLAVGFLLLESTSAVALFESIRFGSTGLGIYDRNKELIDFLLFFTLFLGLSIISVRTFWKGEENVRPRRAVAVVIALALAIAAMKAGLSASFLAPFIKYLLFLLGAALLYFLFTKIGNVEKGWAKLLVLLIAILVVWLLMNLGNYTFWERGGLAPQRYGGFLAGGLSGFGGFFDEQQLEGGSPYDNEWKNFGRSLINLPTRYRPRQLQDQDLPRPGERSLREGVGERIRGIGGEQPDIGEEGEESWWERLTGRSTKAGKGESTIGKWWRDLTRKETPKGEEKEKGRSPPDIRGGLLPCDDPVWTCDEQGATKCYKGQVVVCKDDPETDEKCLEWTDIKSCFDDDKSCKIIDDKAVCAEKTCTDQCKTERCDGQTPIDCKRNEEGCFVEETGAVCASGKMCTTTRTTTGREFAHCEDAPACTPDPACTTDGQFVCDREKIHRCETSPEGCLVKKDYRKCGSGNVCLLDADGSASCVAGTSWTKTPKDECSPVGNVCVGRKYVECKEEGDIKKIGKILNECPWGQTCSSENGKGTCKVSGWGWGLVAFAVILLALSLLNIHRRRKTRRGAMPRVNSFVGVTAEQFRQARADFNTLTTGRQEFIERLERYAGRIEGLRSRR